MPPRTTDRSITTCRNCRRRKIRCDRGRPRCNRCRESGTVCVYEDQVPRQARRYQFVTEMPGNALRQAFNPGQGDNAATTIPIPSDRLQDIETRVDNLNQMLQTLQVQSSMPSSATSSSSGFPALRRTSTGQSLEQGLTDMRYVDLSFITSMCDEVAELGELLSSQTRYLLESTQGSPTDSASEPENETLRPSNATEQAHQQRPAQAAEQETSTSTAPAATEGMMVEGVTDLSDIDWAYFDQVLEGELSQMSGLPGDPGSEQDRSGSHNTRRP